ncbi:hypothetical protein [Pseudotabrizicola sediminis]|uniref:hypothetical protein n=1 Tax=Pseudotabrizicola sediminis TaxID=2486418 RepID=UPI001FDA128C|nr:hypothetical protein [Pseudotabrizicola sediminis]
MSSRIIPAVVCLSLLWQVVLPASGAAGSPIAEVICAPRAEMLQRLTLTYGAQLAGQGVRNLEMVMEVWTTPRGDWTLVQSYTDGRACIVAMGEAWEVVEGDPA